MTIDAIRDKDDLTFQNLGDLASLAISSYFFVFNKSRNIKDYVTFANDFFKTVLGNNLDSYKEKYNEYFDDYEKIIKEFERIKNANEE